MVKVVFLALLMLSALGQDDAAGDADIEEEEEEGPIMIDGFTEDEFNNLETSGEQYEF